MNSDKKWCITFLGLVIGTLIILGAITVIVDPYFHYHKPLTSLEYPLRSERQRYINDGILKNFDYNAIIVGSSMTENFKSSQLDEEKQMRSAHLYFGPHDVPRRPRYVSKIH